MQILYWNWNMKNAPRVISMYFKHNMQNHIISKLYTDDKKTKYSSNINDIFKSAGNSKLYTKRQPPKLLLVNILAKFITQTKISNEKFHLCEADISLKRYNIFFK